jgi:signal transduction histidine kinase
MRRFLSFLTVISFITIPVQAQVLNRDSLLQLLPLAKEDTNKVYLLFSLSDQYETSEPEKAIYYTSLAGGLSRKLNFQTGLLKYNRYLAYIYAYQSRYDSMLHYSKASLEISRARKDTFNIGVSLFNIGEAYKFLSDYENGLQYTLDAVRILDGKGYTNIEANLYGGLQGTYLMLKQYDKAIEYGAKAVEIGRKLTDKSSLVSSLANMANCYGELKKFTEAKKMYAEAISIAKKIFSKSIEAMCYEGLADIALKENQLSLLKTYADHALSLHFETGNNFGIMASKQALAIYYLSTKNFTESGKFANEALDIASTENYLEAKAEVLSTLSAISFAVNDFKSGFNYGDESDKITESIFTESVAQKDAQSRVKYETEKKEIQIKQLEAEKKVHQLTISRKNTLNYILIGGAAVLFIISLLLYSNYKKKQTLQQQRINELEKEKQLTATEAVLKGEEQERTRLAKDLHDGLGGMLSGIKYSLNNMKGNLIMTPDNAQAFERSMDMLDSSIQEMRRVAHNMMPEALVKFGLDTALKDFSTEINRSGALQVSYQSLGMENATIDQTTAITAYRIVQELINNTMKHASARTAIVQVTKSNEQLTITVEDDGKGFDTANLRQSTGIGWTNIQSRIEYLKGRLDIQSDPGKGSSVHIELPV